MEPPNVFTNRNKTALFFGYDTPEKECCFMLLTAIRDEYVFNEQEKGIVDVEEVEPRHIKEFLMNMRKKSHR